MNINLIFCFLHEPLRNFTSVIMLMCTYRGSQDSANSNSTVPGLVRCENSTKYTKSLIKYDFCWNLKHEYRIFGPKLSPQLVLFFKYYDFVFPKIRTIRESPVVIKITIEGIYRAIDLYKIKALQFVPNCKTIHVNVSNPPSC